MKKVLLLLACALLGACATPGHVEEGGESRTPQVFIAGMLPAEVQAYVARNAPASLHLEENAPGTLLYRTPEPVRPLTYARYRFRAEDGGTLVQIREEYHARNRVLAVNNPRFLDLEQRGLDALKGLLDQPAAGSRARTATAAAPHHHSPAVVARRVHCAAVTRAGHRCSRWAQSGSNYCWQHAR